MLRAFQNIDGEKAILLIEDIDSIFVQRNNVDENCKISFSAFLQCLDGASFKEGLIVIITTNHIDKLDSALLRAGRMDIKVEIPLPSIEQVQEYLDKFYEMPSKLYAYQAKLSMAEVQNVCLQNRNNPVAAVEELQK